MVINRKVKAKKTETKKKVRDEELEDKLEELEDQDAKRANIKAKKQAEKEQKRDEAKRCEKDDEKPKKKHWKKILAFLIVVAILGGGGYFAKAYFTKTTVETVTSQFSGDARGFSNYFKEYLLDRMRAEQLFSYSYKELSTDDILAELSELKNGFSKVSRGVSGNYRSSEYQELAEVMESDSSIYLVAVRELRNVMMTSYENLESRQAEFEKKVNETTEGLRSAIYHARAGFPENASGLSSKGALIFKGSVLVEAGGGVANILLGDFAAQNTVVTTDELEETVKAIDAKKLFGYASSRLIKLGDSLSACLEEGWVRSIKTDVRYKEADIITTRISLIMKTAARMNDELKEQGIEGFLKAEEKTEKEMLSELITGLKGKK